MVGPTVTSVTVCDRGVYLEGAAHFDGGHVTDDDDAELVRLDEVAQQAAVLQWLGRADGRLAELLVGHFGRQVGAHQHRNGNLQLGVDDVRDQLDAAARRRQESLP